MLVLRFKSEKRSGALFLENFDEGHYLGCYNSGPDDECGIEDEVPVIMFLVLVVIRNISVLKCW